VNERKHQRVTTAPGGLHHIYPVANRPASVAEPSNVSIAIVDDHLLFAESLEIALAIEGYDVRRIALPDADRTRTLMSTTAAMIRRRFDVALVDLDLGRLGDGLSLVGPLTNAGTAVIVVTASTDHGRWGECLRHGALKVVSKSQPLDDILGTVRRVHEGRPVTTAEDRADLLHAYDGWQSDHAEFRGRLARLTARERDVLGHLSLGRNVGEIASLENVAEATVRTQVKSILAKLEVTSQLAAVGIVHNVGWRAPVS
jgi:DNA-binding NarL/FixJ family response regulator